MQKLFPPYGAIERKKSKERPFYLGVLLYLFRSTCCSCNFVEPIHPMNDESALSALDHESRAVGG